MKPKNKYTEQEQEFWKQAAMYSGLVVLMGAGLYIQNKRNSVLNESSEQTNLSESAQSVSEEEMTGTPIGHPESSKSSNDLEDQLLKSKYMTAFNEAVNDIIGNNLRLKEFYLKTGIELKSDDLHEIKNARPDSRYNVLQTIASKKIKLLNTAFEG